MVNLGVLPVGSYAISSSNAQRSGSGALWSAAEQCRPESQRAADHPSNHMKQASLRRPGRVLSNTSGRQAAHSQMCLTAREAYQDIGAEVYDRKQRDRELARLKQ